MEAKRKTSLIDRESEHTAELYVTLFTCFSICQQEKSKRGLSVHILVSVWSGVFALFFSFSICFWGEFACVCFLFVCEDFFFLMIAGKPAFIRLCGKDQQSKN